MIYSEPGRIDEDFYVLGPMGLPIYLLDGQKPAIFDAGMAFLGPTYTDAIQKSLSNERPAYCMLTHSHFDHCGSVSFFKRQFPELTVVASKAAQTILSRPTAVDLIRTMNHAAAVDACKKYPTPEPFEEFRVDQTVKEGDRIEISSNLSVRVLETPGHTRDSLSYYIPEKKILIASEALGIADSTGYILSDFLVDYDLYVSSMQKLGRLEIEILCLGHHYVFTQIDAQRFLKDAMRYCKEFYHMVENMLLKEDGDVHRVMARVKRIEYDGLLSPKQLESAYLLNLEARINVIRKRLDMNPDR